MFSTYITKCEKSSHNILIPRKLITNLKLFVLTFITRTTSRNLVTKFSIEYYSVISLIY